MFSSMGWKRRFALLALLGFSLITLTACADWWVYNINSKPARLSVIPELKLEEITGNPSSKSDRHKEWAKEFSYKVRGMHGWKPDFCEMSEVKKDLFGNRGFTIKDPKNNNQVIDKDNREFYKSYLRAIPYYLRPDGDPSLDPEEVVNAPYCKQKQKWDQTSTRHTIRVFKEQLLSQIDEDHTPEILVDEDKYNSLRRRRNAWKNQRVNQKRALTVSKENPAALSVSVKKLVPSKEKKKPFFLEVQGGGQGAIVKFAQTFVDQPGESVKERCKGEDKQEKCVKAAVDAVGKLLPALKASPKEANGLEDFNPKQKIELTLSSILNSPDFANRFDYLTTYLYIYPYPYPPNGPVSLEEEFWMRVNALQLPRRKDERIRSLPADLDRGWRSLRVKIDTVQTTVELPKSLEIAKVTRTAKQGVEFTVTPKATGPIGPAGGEVGAQLKATSDLTTTVVESLQKQLDKRSAWLNHDRNLLRITQRGMDAINIAGSIREEVTLHIPTSLDDIPLLEVQDGKIKVNKSTLTQPIYSRVEALAISIAVVREPYKLKRSAAEKFGLPDSADARFIVHVSPPISLTIWQWGRLLTSLTFDDLGVSIQPPHKKNVALLRFFSPAANREGYALINSEEADEFIEKLRCGILNSAKKPQEAECKIKEDSKIAISYKIVKKENDWKNYYYILANIDKDEPDLETIWFGKDEGGKIAPFECNDLPDLEKKLLEKKLLEKKVPICPPS